MTLHIYDTFDSGAINIINTSNPLDIQLAIRPDQGLDGYGEFLQWFYFAMHLDQPQPIRWRLMNAAQAAYPQGWVDYHACASYDRIHWFRVPTHYESGELIVEHTPNHRTIYYAYFEPYTWERHLTLIGQWQQHPLVQHRIIGTSVEQRPIDLLSICHTTQTTPKNIWLIARQHPGETMAQWLIEGLLESLLDPNDAHATALKQIANLYIIPNMNPDGSFRGNLRTNAKGINLNRAWLNPSTTDSPEVYYARQAIAETGVDLFIDVHGDEGLPYLFIEGCEYLAHFND